MLLNYKKNYIDHDEFKFISCALISSVHVHYPCGPCLGRWHPWVHFHRLLATRLTAV